MNLKEALSYTGTAKEAVSHPDYAYARIMRTVNGKPRTAAFYANSEDGVVRFHIAPYAEAVGALKAAKKAMPVYSEGYLSILA